MSLPAKEFRFEGPQEHHTVLKAVAEANGQDLGDYLRKLVADAVRDEVHRHTILQAAFSKAGIVPESAGVGRKIPVAGEAS